MLMFYLSMLKTDEERDFFTELYNKYRQGLYRYAYKYLHNESDAEDIVQDVFCIVIDRCIKDLMERNEDGQRRFLFMCTRNRAIKYEKRRAKVVSLDGMVENDVDISTELTEEPIADIITNRDLLEKAKVAINSLDPKYADVLWMHLEGYSVQDISQFFGEKYGTVKQRLYRSKQLLRVAIGVKGGEE